MNTTTDTIYIPKQKISDNLYRYVYDKQGNIRWYKSIATLKQYFKQPYDVVIEYKITRTIPVEEIKNS